MFTWFGNIISGISGGQLSPPAELSGKEASSLENGQNFRHYLNLISSQKFAQASGNAFETPAKSLLISHKIFSFLEQVASLGQSEESEGPPGETSSPIWMGYFRDGAWKMEPCRIQLLGETSIDQPKGILLDSSSELLRVASEKIASPFYTRNEQQIQVFYHPEIKVETSGFPSNQNEANQTAANIILSVRDGQSGKISHFRLVPSPQHSMVENQKPGLAGITSEVEVKDLYHIVSNAIPQNHTTGEQSDGSGAITGNRSFPIKNFPLETGGPVNSRMSGFQMNPLNESSGVMGSESTPPGQHLSETPPIGQGEKGIYASLQEKQSGDNNSRVPSNVIQINLVNTQEISPLLTGQNYPDNIPLFSGDDGQNPAPSPVLPGEETPVPYRVQGVPGSMEERPVFNQNLPLQNPVLFLGGTSSNRVPLSNSPTFPTAGALGQEANQFASNPPSPYRLQAHKNFGYSENGQPAPKGIQETTNPLFQTDTPTGNAGHQQASVPINPGQGLLSDLLAFLTTEEVAGDTDSPFGKQPLASRFNFSLVGVPSGDASRAGVCEVVNPGWRPSMADSVTDVQHLPTLLKAAGSNEQSISNPIILLTGEELVEWVAKSEWKQFGQWSLNINSEINSHPFFESSRIVRNQGNQLEGQGQAPDQGFSAAMDREFGTHLNRVNQKPASQRITYSVSDPKGIEKVNSSMVKNEVPTGIRPGGPKQPTVMQNMFPGIKTDFVSVKPETTFTNPLTENLPGSPIFPPRASLGDFVDYSGSLLGKERSMLNLQEGMSGSRVPDGTGNTQPSQIGESPLTLPEVMRSVENGEMSSAEKMDDQISENKVLRIRSDGKNGQILIQNSTSKSESSPAFSETPMPAGEKTGFKNSPGFSEQINREMTEKDHPTISALSTKPGEGGRSAFAAITHSSSHSPLSYAEQIEFINSLTKQLQMAVNRSQQEIILHLKPEHLGMVRICLKMKKDMLSGKVEIQNPEAYQLIHKHANELNQRLQELQVNVDKLEFELRDFSQKERSSQDREHFAAHLTARQDFEVGLEEKGMEGARRMSNRLMFANSTFEYIA